MLQPVVLAVLWPVHAPWEGLLHLPRISCHTACCTAAAVPHALHVHTTTGAAQGQAAAAPHAWPPAQVDGAHPLRAVDLVATDAHEVNLPVIHVDWDLAYCLGSVRVQEHLWAGVRRVKV